MHLGATVEAARARVLTAWAAAPGDDGVSPADAAAGMLGLAWRRARLLGAELAAQVAAAEAEGPDGAAGALAGLVGHTYSASDAAGGIYATAERIRGLAELEAAERDRVVRYAVACHQMGVAERNVDIARTLGAALYALADQLLDALGLTAEQAGRIPDELPRILRALPSLADLTDRGPDGAA